MKNKGLRGSFFFILVLSFALNSFAGKPGGCSDVPISWVFESPTTSGYTSAISNDDKGLYREGVDGVLNSVIHVCSGTYDATLGLNRSQRTVSMAFSGIQGTDNYNGGGQFPSFDGTTVSTKPFFNIRNITGHGYPVGTTYYTKMNAIYIKGPGDNRTEYQLAFLPYDASCPEAGLCVNSWTNDNASSDQNSPVSAAWVKVSYVNVGYGQWIAEGEFSDPEIQRGTLLSGSLKVSGGVHRGQFSTPFRIRITALAPLPQ